MPEKLVNLWLRAMESLDYYEEVPESSNEVEIHKSSKTEEWVVNNEAIYSRCIYR